ncbi:flavin-containing monooxygenase [Saccharothrix texasensis]|uniref:Putative flavoprotein involved in K+ transport n=1 Tax=Saccharothrix texasensis TaxID=103734 RepID=A0A3N1H3Z5_9PSEU|nr:NAD(P)/FAD-dependent oxidoreductase [Saccharothrix texasensis]ROP37237.1 putative flavoprotein involved in K+ transport [Saccharothrix texasensis]
MPAETSHDTLVIGGGQAGLAMGQALAAAGQDFLILDAAAEIGSSWRRRWDSLRLFTPARHSGLPGLPFPGPADHMPGKDEVADYLAAYARRFSLPVRLGAAVRRLSRTEDGRFQVLTDHATHTARAVVVATGPFQRPAVPPFGQRLNSGITQIHTADYRNPGRLPSGPVLVVGAGNSGVQIAEELARTHRVTLAVGARQPALPQRLLGRDLFTWLESLGVMRVPADTRLGRRLRERDPLIGASLRRLRRQGVLVRNRVTSVREDRIHTADGHDIAPTTVVWATGYRADYSWLDIPGAVGTDGWPQQTAGVSPTPGLYFLGLPFQRNRGSALLGWVGRDAATLLGELITTTRTPYYESS